jgi:MtN3 and saliva related transmembrane protein
MGQVDFLGFIGGALTTFGLIPQILRIYTLKSAKEISLIFTILMLIGIGCWLIYGIVKRLPPVIFWNSLALILFLILLIGKLKYGKT